jgi:hypothetical protein
MLFSGLTIAIAVYMRFGKVFMTRRILVEINNRYRCGSG